MKYINLLFLTTIIYSQDIGFIGDSITKSGYNIIIEEYIDSIKTYNFSSQGITVANGNNNFRNSKEYDFLLEIKPKYSIVLLGSNDVRFVNVINHEWLSIWSYEYKWLLIQLLKFSRVQLCTIPYQLKSNSDEAINKINNNIYRIAREFNIHVIDLNKSLGKNWEYFEKDGVHPNKEGRIIMANTVMKYLNDNYFNYDKDYWDSVQDYEEQKRVGWFGCKY